MEVEEENGGRREWMRKEGMDEEEGHGGRKRECRRKKSMMEEDDNEERRRARVENKTLTDTISGDQKTSQQLKSSGHLSYDLRAFHDGRQFCT